MAGIMFAERKGVEDDIAAFSNPSNGVEVEVASLIEARPSEEVSTVQWLHSLCFLHCLQHGSTVMNQERGTLPLDGWTSGETPPPGHACRPADRCPGQSVE